MTKQSTIDGNFKEAMPATTRLLLRRTASSMLHGLGPLPPGVDAPAFSRTSSHAFIAALILFRGMRGELGYQYRKS